MNSPDRDLSRALAGALVLAAAVVLILTLKLPGVLLSVLLGTCVVIFSRGHRTNPEIAALRRSLQFARDDIAEVLDAYDQLLHGPTAADIADRTLHFPALANPDMSVPAINEFLLRASSARRFLSRVDSYLESSTTDRLQLEKIISIADERALELQTAWDDARRAAREIGPA